MPLRSQFQCTDPDYIVRMSVYSYFKFSSHIIDASFDFVFITKLASKKTNPPEKDFKKCFVGFKICWIQENVLKSHEK